MDKIALTEVAPSEGDCSPPEVHDNMSPNRMDEVPEHLRDLDKCENIDDTLEIQSLHSHRLYTLSPDQEAVAMRKTAAKHKKVNSR